MFYKWCIFLIYAYIIGSAVFGNHDTNFNMFLASIGLKSAHIITFAPVDVPSTPYIGPELKWEKVIYEPNVGFLLVYLGFGAILIHILSQEIGKTSSQNHNQTILKRVK